MMRYCVVTQEARVNSQIDLWSHVCGGEAERSGALIHNASARHTASQCQHVLSYNVHTSAIIIMSVLSWSVILVLHNCCIIESSHRMYVQKRPPPIQDMGDLGRLFEDPQDMPLNLSSPTTLDKHLSCSTSRLLVLDTTDKDRDASTPPKTPTTPNATSFKKNMLRRYSKLQS